MRQHVKTVQKASTRKMGPRPAPTAKPAGTWRMSAMTISFGRILKARIVMFTCQQAIVVTVDMGHRGPT